MYTTAIELDIDTTIRELDKDETYKYLEIDEGNGIQLSQMKEKVRKECQSKSNIKKRIELS